MTSPTSPSLSGAQAYMSAARAAVDAVIATQAESIAAAAAACVRAIDADGLIYLFGTGHSHMMAEEGHYRAGGLAAVVPILASAVMLHEGALASTRLERLPGLAEAVLSRYPMAQADVLFVFSNSGVNAVPVEAARYGREQGATVVGVTSLDYSRAVARPPLGRRLADVADIVIDNCGPPGDAVAEVPGSALRVGPASTLTGALILNAVLAETVWRLTADGRPAPVYISANMPDAKAHNEQLAARYRRRNPHL